MLLLDNAALALAPLIVLVQVAQLDTEWRAVRFTLLGVSILVYAARLGVTQLSAKQDRRHIATAQPGNGFRRERNRDCGCERPAHLCECRIRPDAGTRECGIYRGVGRGRKFTRPKMSSKWKKRFANRCARPESGMDQ